MVCRDICQLVQLAGASQPGDQNCSARQKKCNTSNEESAPYKREIVQMKVTDAYFIFCTNCRTNIILRNLKKTDLYFMQRTYTDQNNFSNIYISNIKFSISVRGLRNQHDKRVMPSINYTFILVHRLIIHS